MWFASRWDIKDKEIHVWFFTGKLATVSNCTVYWYWYMVLTSTQVPLFNTHDLVSKTCPSFSTEDLKHAYPSTYQTLDLDSFLTSWIQSFGEKEEYTSMHGSWQSHFTMVPSMPAPIPEVSSVSLTRYERAMLSFWAPVVYSSIKYGHILEAAAISWSNVKDNTISVDLGLQDEPSYLY